MSFKWKYTSKRIVEPHY